MVGDRLVTVDDVLLVGVAKVCDWNSENDGMSLSVAAIAGEARVAARTAAEARANCPRRLRCMKDLLKGVVVEARSARGSSRCTCFPRTVRGAEPPPPRSPV